MFLLACKTKLQKRGNNKSDLLKWYSRWIFFGVFIGYESCAINDNWGYRMSSSSSSNPFFVPRFVSLAEKASKPKRKQKQKKKNLLRVNRHRNSNKSQLTYWKTIFNHLRIFCFGKMSLPPTLIKIHPQSARVTPQRNLTFRLILRLE